MMLLQNFKGIYASMEEIECIAEEVKTEHTVNNIETVSFNNCRRTEAKSL